MQFKILQDLEGPKAVQTQSILLVFGLGGAVNTAEEEEHSVIDLTHYNGVCRAAPSFTHVR